MNWLSLTINGFPVNIAFDEDSIHIYNAFPIKDDLKVRGYRWDPQDKSWHIEPEDVNQEMAVLKNNLQPAVASVESPPGKDGDERFPRSYSIVQLRNRVEQVVRDGLSGQVWVRGLVASEVKEYQWASYFDLKDEDESSDLFFRSEMKRDVAATIKNKLRQSGVADDLSKDLPVFVLVDIHLASRYSVDVRLQVRDILPEYTQARLKNQREITLEKLHQEGILKNQQQLSLPRLIFRVGLITSNQGTSIQDIMAALSPFEKRYQFYFLDTRMEGASAVAGLIKAIDYFETLRTRAPLDALIIARGGGSEQSLAVFNDYRLCRRVCLARVPIITAIGHEKDLSAIEICSHLTPTPSTPSGVGRFLHSRYGDIQQELMDSIQALVTGFARSEARELERLKGILRHIPLGVGRTFKLRGERLDHVVGQLKQSVSFAVSQEYRNIKRELASFRSLAASLCQRHWQHLHTAVKRLDFDKRYRQNQLAVKQLQESGFSLLIQGKKRLAEVDQRIRALNDLVLASDPDLILKKGFTLTLDDQERVVKTYQSFKPLDRAILKFSDGTAIIKEDES